MARHSVGMFVLAAAFWGLSTAITRGQTPGGSISPAEAAAHVGEQATVCGLVASATYASRSRSQPTFLNLDRPYPQHIFTVVIFGSDRAKFGAPELRYRDKRICVTGLIKLYRGILEIIASDPKQIREQLP